MGSIAKIGYLFYILGFLFCYFKRLIIKLSTKDRNKELRSLEVQKSGSPVITIIQVSQVTEASQGPVLCEAAEKVWEGLYLYIGC